MNLKRDVTIYFSAIAFLSMVQPSQADLLVSHPFGQTIARFDSLTGAPLPNFADTQDGVRGPEGMVIGPDGRLFVVMDDISTNPENVSTFNLSGEFLGIFADLGTDSFPNDLAFGPTGDLFVSSAKSDDVRRYNGTTGAFLGVFSFGNGLGDATGIAFGPDGNLYVASRETDQVLKFNGTSGAFIKVFAFGGGLDEPSDLIFGPDGNLFVGSRNSDQIKRYSGSTGAFIDTFASGAGLDAPDDLAFGPDGHLYVTSFFTNEVKRYHGATGAFIDDFVSIAGPNYPSGLLFIPIPEPNSLYLLFPAVVTATVFCKRSHLLANRYVAMDAD